MLGLPRVAAGNLLLTYRCANAVVDLLLDLLLRYCCRPTVDLLMRHCKVLCLSPCYAFCRTCNIVGLLGATLHLLRCYWCGILPGYYGCRSVVV